METNRLACLLPRPLAAGWLIRLQQNEHISINLSKSLFLCIITTAEDDGLVKQKIT
jgi:hypothetical protein